jgi:hypothetical protein
MLVPKVTVTRAERVDQTIVLHVLNLIDTNFFSTCLTLKRPLDAWNRDVDRDGVCTDHTKTCRLLA